jgi:uncharacterized protein YdaU (DUF1376 family)
VNFYKRFIGDITAKTGGLTLAQFGAYDRLLDHYYSTEKPIPPEECYSICRAMTRADRADVDKVLGRYWELTAEGWTQSKADEVIEKARPLIEAARENGKKGGRPKKTKNPEETQGVPKQNPDGTQSEPSAKASQSQSQTHSPSLRSGDVGSDALPGVPPPLFADYMEVRRAKKAGKFTLTAAAGILREAGKAGVSAERALQACCEYGWIGFNAEWFAQRQSHATPRGLNGSSGSATRAARMAEALAPTIRPQGDFIDSEVRDVTPRSLG